MKTNRLGRPITFVLGAALTLVSSVVMTQTGVEVVNAWARATVPGQRVGGVYMDIRSATPARLVSVSSSAASSVEIHKMKIENGVMKMFPIDVVDLPARQYVKLAPGSYHVMLRELKHELKQGENVSVALTVELADKTRQTIEVKAEIRDITGARIAR